MECTDITKDQWEVVHYTIGNIPVYMSTSALSQYLNKRALCHWHEDLEFIWMLKGRMNYYVNGRNILLNESDCLMVNSRQLHYGFSHSDEDCRFTCILFHPRLLGTNENLFKQYVLPVLEHSGLEYLHFEHKEAAATVIPLLDQMVLQIEKNAFGHEMEIVAILYRLWNQITQRIGRVLAKDADEHSSDLKVQKDMVSYIYQNYGGKLTLADIAASGHVCRSKCCHIFKHFLNQSPIDFLNSFRLKVSSERLVNTEDSITEIAFSCGFNHLSYYSKLFFLNYGCTPRDFRKKHRAFQRDERSRLCAEDTI